MVQVDMHDVKKWYGDFHVLRDITLQVTRGERIVICGPSGSGKSTMIRCINRLEAHQQGRIVVAGTELTADAKAIDHVRRTVGMVFQQFNLVPASGLVLAKLCARADLGEEDAEARRRGDRDALSETESGFRAYGSNPVSRPAASARVAIARALCMRPDIAFDEPTSSLDPDGE
jgi:general L-amino acid transport system ATP-binding protein